MIALCSLSALVRLWQPCASVHRIVSRLRRPLPSWAWHWKTVLDRRFRSVGKISSNESGLYGWLVRIDLLGNDGQGQYTLLSRRGWFDQDGTSSAKPTPRPGVCSCPKLIHSRSKRS